MGTRRYVAVGKCWGLLLAILLLGAWLTPANAEDHAPAASPAAGPAGAPAFGPGNLPPGVTPEMYQRFMERRGRRGGGGEARPVEPPKVVEAPKPAEGPKPPEGEKKPEGEAKPEEKKPETPSAPTVTRPTSPPKPGNPEELKVQPDADGKVLVNFSNQKWLDVLEWLADTSHMSLDWQELPGDYLNYVSVERQTIPQVRDLINYHLLARGFTLLRRGDVMSVVKLDKLNPALVPWVRPEQLDERDPHEFVRVTFSLDWLLAEPTAKELEPMRSPVGKLSPLTSTNRIEAMDVVVNLREIQRVLAEEQSKTGKDRVVQTFALKYTHAGEVRELLMSLLGVEDKKKGPLTPEQMQQMQQQRQQQPGQPGPPEKKEPEIHIVADERMNTVVVSAPPDKMAIVAEAVKSIDQPPAAAEGSAAGLRPKTYRLESLDPEAVIKTLKSLGGLSVSSRFEADKTNKSVIAYATPTDQVMIASAIDKLDGGRRRSHVLPLTDLRADSVARTVDFMMGGGPDESEKKKDDSSSEEMGFNPFMPNRSASRRSGGNAERHEDRFRVDSDTKGNRLLLWCNEYELAKVEELLENLHTTSTAAGLADAGGRSFQVHRLVTLDPEPVVKMLKESEVLSVGTTVEPDKTSRAIIANATEEEHRKIDQFLARLDGSGRNFEVVSLRRLQADSVAATVAFMMTGKEEEKKSNRSPWDYWGGRSRDNNKKQEDAFRVDADLQYNRLLLWANTVEMEEVHKLLVKLGEIPSRDGNPNTIRILDIPAGPERERLLEQLRRVWPSTAPNPLEIPPRPATPPETPAKPKLPPKEPEPAASRTTQTAPARSASPFRLAQMEQPAAPETKPAAADAPAAEAPATAAHTPAAPIRVTEAPDGRLILSSEDTEALDQLEIIISQLTPPQREYEMIRLRYAEAYWVSQTLKDFFTEKEKKGEDDGWSRWWGMPSSSSEDTSRRLSKRKPMKFISDDTTNSILIQGATPDQMRTIKELVDVYDRPPMADSESARRTETFKIHYAKVGTVVEAIKDVYRDLLSDNDKALAGGKKQESRGSGETLIFNYGGDKKEVEKKPKFKGYLSLGFDTASNTLVISAPEFLFRDISRLVIQLDEAARPTSDQLYVMRLKSGINGEKLQERLKTILQTSQSRNGEEHKEGAPESGENHGPKNGPAAGSKE